MSLFPCSDPACPHCESACETCGHPARRSSRWACDHCGLQSPCDGGKANPPYYLIPEGCDDTTSALYELDACSLECFKALMAALPDDPVVWDYVTEAD